MQRHFKQSIVAILITLPLVFMMVFLGYFPVHYDVILQTDNIIGEGICQSYGSQVDGHTSVNLVTFYFGSELKKATITGFNYDVPELFLVTSGVSEFDITGIDSYIKGLHLSHFDANAILPEGETLEGTKAVISSHDGILHVEVFDPDLGATVTFGQHFIPAWFWFLYFTVILFISILTAIVIQYIMQHVPALCLPLMSAAGLMVVLLAGCFFCGSLSYITYNNFLMNCLLLIAVSLFLNALTLPFLGTVFVMVFITIWYIANYFVITLRGKPIMPADLKAIGTAKEVLGGYTFLPNWKMVLGIVIVIFYIFMIIYIWRIKNPKEKQSITKKLLKRGITLVVSVLLIYTGINTQTFKSLNTFAWDTVLMKSFHREGMVLTYVKSIFNSQVKKPEGYSSELVDSFLLDYQTSPAKQEEITPTNIIMVMNEAFSDLRTVGLNKQMNIMPFIDSLDENIVEGNLYVGVFGGGTCNTEFEGLTGNTLAFLGVSAYPYTENLTQPLFSLASYFSNLGYITEAFHANEADNWNRNLAYPNLGFQAFHSIKDYKAFGEITYLHNLPADISDYKFIEAVDEKYSGLPRFLFNVTMQNHSPYERWLDVPKANAIEEHGLELYPDAQVYISLIKASDNQLKQLVETYQDVDEPTMIIFFGDHQPGLPTPAINQVYSNVLSNLDLYKTKFFIWTNYKSPEWHDAEISANYLPWLILERGNFPLPPYVQMLKELHEKYPVISVQGVKDSTGNIYSGVAEVLDDPLIQKYQYIQYANLFDVIDPAWFQVKKGGEKDGEIK